MTGSPGDRVMQALREADRHHASLEQALSDWSAVPAPDWQRIESDTDLGRLTDQILFRFIKLQDVMGERLVPATLGHLHEPYEDWSMRDRLDRLEKLGFVEVEPWLQWRVVRNRLAHEVSGRA